MRYFYFLYIHTYSFNFICLFFFYFDVFCFCQNVICQFFKRNIFLKIRISNSNSKIKHEKPATSDTRNVKKSKRQVQQSNILKIFLSRTHFVLLFINSVKLTLVWNFWQHKCSYQKPIMSPTLNKIKVHNFARVIRQNPQLLTCNSYMNFLRYYKTLHPLLDLRKLLQNGFKVWTHLKPRQRKQFTQKVGWA